MEEVIIIGAGGHAKVVTDIIIKSGDKVLGFLDDNIEMGKEIVCGIKVIGKISDCYRYESSRFIIAIGNNKIRKEIYEKYPHLYYYIAIHPKAYLGLDVKIGDGTVIMPNACINSGAVIGSQCIINTGAIVEHDNKIEKFAHICPGATLAGTVKVGMGTQIGANATVKNNITIAANNLIGAGAVVVKDIIEENKIYVGVPARIKE